MQRKLDIPIPKEDDNILEYFGLYQNKKYTLNKNNIEKHHKNLISKNSDTESCAKYNLSGRTLQNGLLANRLSLFLREIRFDRPKFFANKSISDIKCHHFGSQNNHFFIYLMMS